MKRNAFSLVEIIITVSIIILLSIVGVTINNSMKSKSDNSKVITDIGTIKTAMLLYKADNNTILIPKGNLNYFSNSGTYVHSQENAYGVFGKFTQDILSNKYLNSSPIDPKTNEFYSYGVKIKDNQFEIAGVVEQNGIHIARVSGDYDGVGGIFSLIREYNGPNFIRDGRSYLPYDPLEKILIATDINGKIYREGETIINSGEGYLEIFFSDGSTSLLSPGSELTLTELSFPKENKLSSKIKLFLNAGSIWTQATRLNNESSFDIFTSDTTASVRGTIFQVRALENYSEVLVVQGEVDVVYKNVEVFSLKDGEKFDSSNQTTISVDGIVEPAFTPPNYIITPIADQIISFDLPILNSAEELLGDNGDCFLEDYRVYNGTKITAYKEYNNCEDNELRKCENGVMMGNIEYKYSKCEGTVIGQCTGELPTNSKTIAGPEIIQQTITPGIGTATQTPDNPWTHESEKTGDFCIFECNDNYTWNTENKTCEPKKEEGICKWLNGIKPDNIITNNNDKFIKIYDPNSKLFLPNEKNWEFDKLLKSECSFACIKNYEWNGSICREIKKQVECIGLPKNAIWNTENTIEQNLDGIPSNIGVYNTNPSEKECRFICKEGYTWNTDNKTCDEVIKDCPKTQVSFLNELYNIESAKHRETKRLEKSVIIDNGTQKFEKEFTCNNGKYNDGVERFINTKCNQGYKVNSNTNFCEPNSKRITSIIYNNKTYSFTDFTLTFGTTQNQSSKPFNITGGTITFNGTLSLLNTDSVNISDASEVVTCNKNYTIQANQTCNKNCSHEVINGYSLPQTNGGKVANPTKNLTISGGTQVMTQTYKCDNGTFKKTGAETIKNVKCYDGYYKNNNICTEVGIGFYSNNGSKIQCNQKYTTLSSKSSSEKDCIYNPFGNEYSLVYANGKGDNNINGDFGLVFTSNQISLQKMLYYNYVTINGKRLVASENKKYKLFNKNGDVSYYTIENYNENQTLNILFENDNWNIVNFKNKEYENAYSINGNITFENINISNPYLIFKKK